MAQAQFVTVRVYGDLTDQYGAKTHEVLVATAVVRSTAERFSYEGLRDRVFEDNKIFLCAADAYLIHAVVYSQIKDKGCLIGPLKANRPIGPAGLIGQPPQPAQGAGSAAGEVPKLGSSRAVFAAAYGPPVRPLVSAASADQLGYVHCPGSYIDEFAVNFRNDKAVSIVKDECSSSRFTESERLAGVMEYLQRADALTHVPADVTGGSMSIINGDHVYTYISASLRAAFPADAFMTCLLNPAPAGSLTITLSSVSSSWTVAIGQCG